jgi:hypothetical protein
MMNIRRRTLRPRCDAASHQYANAQRNQAPKYLRCLSVHGFLLSTKLALGGARLFAVAAGGAMINVLNKNLNALPQFLSIFLQQITDSPYYC